MKPAKHSIITWNVKWESIHQPNIHSHGSGTFPPVSCLLNYIYRNHASATPLRWPFILASSFIRMDERTERIILEDSWDEQFSVLVRDAGSLIGTLSPCYRDSPKSIPVSPNIFHPFVCIAAFHNIWSICFYYHLNPITAIIFIFSSATHSGRRCDHQFWFRLVGLALWFTLELNSAWRL